MKILQKYNIYTDDLTKEKLYPFHNDKFMILFILENIENIEIFIETGSYIGKTIFFMTSNFPNIKCYSCEVNTSYYEKANRMLKNYSNVTYKLEKSPDFLYNLNKNLFEKNTLFWLDAHWGSSPIFKEVEFITKHFSKFIIIIDDFKIPWDKGFSCEKYSFFNIRPYIRNIDKLKFYMPDYKSETVNNPVGYVIITNFNELNLNNLNNLKDVTKLFNNK